MCLLPPVLFCCVVYTGGNWGGGKGNKWGKWDGADMRRGATDGRIAPRSGLAVKYHIDTGAGVVDADYRGEVRVLLFNHGGEDFEGGFCTWVTKRGNGKGGLMWLCSQGG